jgi:periplasmic divalent cation tolerance protein
MGEPIVVMTTTNTQKEAKTLAGLLVENGFAACVQIIPKINSIYVWQGKIHDDQEYLLLIKTLDDKLPKLRKAIEDNHSYEVPEFLVLPVAGASQDYLEWMKNVTR